MEVKLEIQLPKSGTKSSIIYYDSMISDLEFFFFIIDTVLIVDYIPYHAKKTLELIDGMITEEEIEKNPVELMNNTPGKNMKHLRKHSQEFIEMIFSRLIDNFKIYIVSLVREILQVKPEILHNNQPTISIAQLLKGESLDTLILEVIESKISTLANKGFGSIEEWCIANGIPLTVKEDYRKLVVEFIAIRNIIIHNRCIVDEKYMRATPDCDFKLGSLRKLTVDDLYKAINIFNEIVIQTDTHAVSKYHLETNAIDEKSCPTFL